MNLYTHDNILPNKNSSLSKTEQVSFMFDSISTKYDLLNTILSFNLDKKWRKKAILKLLENKPELVLDVATGTADMAIEMAKKSPTSNIIGIDISPKMIDIGKQKILSNKLSQKIQLKVADSLNLPFSDDTFDAVMVSFGIRNFENLDQGLSEILRVLKPTGKLIILEFSTPTNAWFKPFVLFYISIIAPFIAFIFSKNYKAYYYLNKSIQYFPQGENLKNILEKLGYKNINFQKLNFQICTIYEAKK